MLRKYEVRDIDQTAEIAALKAERDQLRAANTEWKRQCARLRAALQHIYDLDIRLTTETVEEIARRVLEGK